MARLFPLSIYLLVAWLSISTSPTHGEPSKAYIQAVGIASQIMSALQSAGLTSFATLLSTTDVGPGYLGFFTSPSATVTILAPTNNVLNAYASNGMISIQQLEVMLRYHHVLGLFPSSSLATLPSGSTLATILPNMPVMFLRGSAGIAFTTPRNVPKALASVVIKDVLISDRVVIHAINKVLAY
eukprot:TRINITY_DN6878_c0_g1_i1.p1 TRINITY_DN6878_c0_g1~~TRINITY_DN6878_c0_g1_i1.p1  ORF type:complete len:184 (+),score=8.24 TRINITY_DN6878_c0_g1_i1:42-593(+)